jgi:5-methylcytosine-specific restriction endonuclease McrA
VLVSYDEVLTTIDNTALTGFPGLKVSLRQVLTTSQDKVDIKVPAVILTRRKVTTRQNGVRFSKVNVCVRDHFSCQYCGEQLPMSDLNYDHVIPKSRGGKTTWTNISMACYTCNERKGNRTPEEAGMPLLSTPVKPKTLPLNGPYIVPEYAPKEWLPYLDSNSFVR